MKKVTKNLIKVSGVIMASLTVGELTQPILASSTSNLRTERSAKKVSNSSTRRALGGVPYVMNLEQDNKTPNSSVRSTNTVMYYITTKDSVWYYGCLKNNKLVIVPFGITKHDGHECIAAYYQGKTHYRRTNTKTESIDMSTENGDISYDVSKISPNYQVKKLMKNTLAIRFKKAKLKTKNKLHKERPKNKLYKKRMQKHLPRSNRYINI